MQFFFYFDASALAKRYAPEVGSALIHYLFQRVSAGRTACLALGALEVISVLVRKKNSSSISTGAFTQAMIDVRGEVIDAAQFKKIGATNALVFASSALLEKHGVNATDAVTLQSALDLAQFLRSAGNDLVVVASDQRLLRAAQAEGLRTFDPETQDQAALDALLGP